MSAIRIDEIKTRMEQKSNEELLEVWIKNDREEWSDDAFEAIREVLAERKVTIPVQKVLKEEDRPRETKGPVGWRFARFVAALLFTFFCGMVSLGIAQLVSGLYVIGCVSLILGTAPGVACAISVRWLSRKSYPNATGGEHPIQMGVVGLTAVVYFALFLALKSPSDTTWGLLTFVSYALVWLGGIWLLVRCKRFMWRNYAVVGLGIAALSMPICIPQMQSMRGVMWAADHEGAFRSLIQKVQSAGLGNEKELHEVVAREIDPQFLRGVKDPMIALLAENADQSRQSLLRLSPVCGQLPKHVLADSPNDVRTVLIHGEPAVFRGAMPQRHDVVSPVLVYSWPDRKLLCSGRLFIGDAEWGISRGEAYQTLAQKIKQAAGTSQ